MRPEIAPHSKFSERAGNQHFPDIHVAQRPKENQSPLHQITVGNQQEKKENGPASEEEHDHEGAHRHVACKLGQRILVVGDHAERNPEAYNQTTCHDDNRLDGFRISHETCVSPYLKIKSLAIDTAPDPPTP